MAAGKGSRTLLLSLVADNSKFDKGLKKSQSAFSKWGNAIKAAAAGAALAVAAFAAKWLGDGVQAAIAAEKVERRFAKTLKNVTKATDAQVASVEEYITATQMATGINDDELRKSMEFLLRRTKDVTKAQKLQAVAMDLSAGADISLEQATKVLIKAQNGQFKGLENLGIKIDDNTKKNKDYKKALELTANQMAGQSAEAADTVEGKYRRFQERMAEVEEDIGTALLPALGKIGDWLNSPQGQAAAADFADNLGTAVTKLGDAMKTLTEGGEDSALNNVMDLMTGFIGLVDNVIRGYKIFFNSPEWNDATMLMRWMRGDFDVPGAPSKFGPQAIPPAPNQLPGLKGMKLPQINITVNGSTDPAATAKAVQKALNQSGYGARYFWTGKGTG